jgi:hypothetical protein
MRSINLVWLSVAAVTLAMLWGDAGTPGQAVQPQPAVKGPNTPASAGDPSLVVTQSPNSVINVKTYVSAGSGQFALTIGTNTTLAVPTGTKCAQFTLEGNSIRRTSDGSSASTTNGTLIIAGSQWQDCGPLAAYRFTAVSGIPSMDVEYFK